MNQPSQRPAGKHRLVVEIASRVAEQLNDLVVTEQTNKTTVVNKAVQALHLLRAAEQEGGEILIRRADGRIERLTILI